MRKLRTKCKPIRANTLFKSMCTISFTFVALFNILLLFSAANMQKKYWTVYLSKNIVRNGYCINHLFDSFSFWWHIMWLETICFRTETIYFILEEICDDRWKTLLKSMENFVIQKRIGGIFWLKKTLMEISHSEKNSIKVVNFSHVCLSKKPLLLNVIQTKIIFLH